MLQIFLFFVLLALVAFFVGAGQSERPRIKNTLSHWQQSISGLHGSTSQVYTAIENVIKAHEFPGVEVRRVALYEGSSFSAKREYLRIEREELSFDVCVASFGKGLFVSSWLCQRPSFAMQVFAYFPIINWIALAWVTLFQSPTYYRVDSEAMFLDAIHGCVLAVLDEMTNAQGVDPIPASERKPVMRELYGRQRSRGRRPVLA